MKLRLFVLGILLCTIAATQAQSLIPELSFKNPVLKTGKGCAGDGLDGAVYIFENVGWGVDAQVTILGRSSAEVMLSDADIKGPEQNENEGTGYDNAWQPRIKFANGHAEAHQTWWIEFKVSFVKHGQLNDALMVNQFKVTGLGIDGDGKQMHEFQAFYKSNSFSLEHQTAIFASSVLGSEKDPLLRGKRFDGPTRNDKGISVSASDAMVNNFYTGSSSMIVRLGAETGNIGSDSADRMYGLLFRSLVIGIPDQQKKNDNLVAMNLTINNEQFYKTY